MKVGCMHIIREYIIPIAIVVVYLYTSINSQFHGQPFMWRHWMIAYG